VITRACRTYQVILVVSSPWHKQKATEVLSQVSALHCECNGDRAIFARATQ